MMKFKFFEFIDVHLGYLGLCRHVHFNDMRQNYAKVISMSQRQAKRANEKVEQLTHENIDLKQQLYEARECLKEAKVLFDVN